MPQAKDLEIGNYLIYKPNGVYCSVTAKDTLISVEALLFSTRCTADDLIGIKVTPDILSPCGFRQREAIYVKRIPPDTVLTIRYNDRTFAELIDPTGEMHYVGLLHQLQNVHFKLTGQPLQPNIFGLKV